MALALASATLGYNAAGLAPVVAQRAAAPVMEKVADLQRLADEQQIPMGYWDPLGMVNLNLFDMGEEGTIGWLRHCEIKHGRVAMAAFVGFCVQANGIAFPWAITGGPLADSSTLFTDIAANASPLDQWDAVPGAGKMQILLTMAFLEVVGERMTPHYTKGGKPGFYPSLVGESDGNGLIPHPVPLDLFDPFGLFKGQSEESKARGRNVEINNGRAAMLGIFGLISASKGLIVPGLDAVGLPQSSGQPMAFFGPDDTFPLVQKMWEGVATTPWLAGSA